MTTSARACSLALLLGGAVGRSIPSAHAADYLVGAGDLLHIEVYGEPLLTGDPLVPVGCTVDVPLIGAVQACKRTVAQIEADVRQRLADGYLVDPRVIVAVTTYGSQKVAVGGAVKTPGLQILRGDTPLTEVITAAGGPLDTNVLEVEHSAREAGTTTLYSLAELYAPLSASSAAPGKGDAGAAPTPAVMVRAGDSVHLRYGRQIYVDGEVKEEGPVPYRAGLTVTQAITLAGGPSPYASRRKVYVLTGKGERVVVKLSAVRAGKIPDYVLGPDDRITLPRSWF